MRHDLHFVFLSVPDRHHEKQVLCQLQNLRLGTFYDVYSNAVYSEFLQLEFVFYFLSGVDSLGNRLCKASAAVLEWF